MALPWSWIVASAVVVAVAWLAQTPDNEKRGKQANSKNTDKPVEKRKLSSNRDMVVYAIGDLHGDVHCAKHWVKKTGLINETSGEWASKEDARLVFVGDYCDKGPMSRPTMEYVKSLTDRFPERVTALMGNHEMELLLDRDKRRHEVWDGAGYYQMAFCTVHPAEYRHYLLEEEKHEKDDLVIEVLYNASIEVYGENQHRNVILSDAHGSAKKESIFNYVQQPPELRDLVQERLKVFQQAYMRVFRTGTELGTWLEQRPIVAEVGNTLFVHGGVSSAGARLLAAYGVAGVNQLAAKHATEDKLQPFIQGTNEGRVVYDLLTFRGNHPRSACVYLPQLLPPGVERLSVGHTPADNVRFSCDNRFLAIDSALGRWFRNSGNDYCPGDKEQYSSNGHYACPRMNEQCEGQIIRIQGDEIRVIS